MKKLLAMIALSGVLSASAFAATTQAAERATACCTNPSIVEFSEVYRGNPYPDYHYVCRRTGLKCNNCHEILEIYSDEFLGIEEHDYDYYDLNNHRRYCECGDFIDG